MKRLASAVVPFLVVAAAVFFLLRDEVHFLRSYEGRVVRAYNEVMGDASTGGVNSDHMVEIETGSGRIQVEVPLSVFNQARAGMFIRKRPFSSKVSVTP
mgnify:CR=1 FL=1